MRVYIEPRLVKPDTRISSGQCPRRDVTNAVRLARSGARDPKFI
jgi:hypothetical protein